MSIELFWREFLSFEEWDHPNTRQVLDFDKLHQSPVQLLAQFLRIGEPFELIDGDNLRIPEKTLKKAFAQVAMAAASDPKSRVCVLSILGPQSSGKSTLLNFAFGCKFSTSKGRCTKGVYGSLVEIEHEDFDYLLVLDTEGLQSPEKEDTEFDRKITLFCLAISHMVLINVAKDMNLHMKELLEICLTCLGILEKARMPTPEFFMIFNQNAGDISDKSVFIEQLKEISNNIIASDPGAREAAQAMQLRSERIKILPLATNTMTIPRDDARGQAEDWNQERPSTRFAVEVAELAADILAAIGARRAAVGAAAVADLEHWLQMAADNWRTIEQYPDLYRFANVKLMQESRRLGELTLELESKYLTSPEATQEQGHEVERLVRKLVDKNHVLNPDHVKNVMGKLETGLRDYYDRTYEEIDRCFREVVTSNEKYDIEILEE